jgi:hypothetical protein
MFFFMATHGTTHVYTCQPNARNRTKSALGGVPACRSLLGAALLFLLLLLFDVGFHYVGLKVGRRDVLFADLYV